MVVDWFDIKKQYILNCLQSCCDDNCKCDQDYTYLSSAGVEKKGVD